MNTFLNLPPKVYNPVRPLCVNYLCGQVPFSVYIDNIDTEMPVYLYPQRNAQHSLVVSLDGNGDTCMHKRVIMYNKGVHDNS